MSLWQFSAAIDGWNKAQGGEDPIEPPSAEEFYELVEKFGPKPHPSTGRA